MWHSSLALAPPPEPALPVLERSVWPEQFPPLPRSKGFVQGSTFGQIAPGPPEIRNSPWPNPVPYAPLRQPGVWRPATSAPDAPAPAAHALEWPNPVRRLVPPETYSWLGILILQEDPAPIVSGVILPPRGRRHPHQGYVYGSTFYLPVAAPALPTCDQLFALPPRGYQRAHVGAVNGETQRIPAPVVAAVSTGFWLIRARRRMIGDD